jgi:cytochrome c-type biogenesis protein CcmH/NrfF
MLWAAGPVLFLIGAVVSVAFIRRRRTQEPDALSEDEKKRLEELLDN